MPPVRGSAARPWSSSPPSSCRSSVLGGGDLTIAYPDSATCTGSARTGCLVRVTLEYRQPLFVPLVGTFLSTDGSNRIAFSANVTMVIN